MSTEKVREYLKQWNMQDRIRELDCSSATVALAAQAINCIPARIAKTLSFKSDHSCILIVAAGDAKVDNTKFKAMFHMKATMLNPDEALSLVGYEVGGICPFGVNNDVDVYTDISLKRFDTVFPAGGCSNSVIELSCDELFQYGNSKGWIDVCKGWELNSL